ncbi:iron-sulfur cluster biosynthesis family protein [Thermoflavimicrobium daqui]|uniref:Core domain-containing protein n=1 Tax=Thermoflavimicrobium daqui TaxID=2137476 RepID=A0A364K7X5_9BACL|nr:iron-sulfur cluster biosynthesis family protein [Thermoflavimicrobium daqui]RAL26393.1 hypothetical protein DL897_05220 [Thermoflavimicrobium daqui]
MKISTEANEFLKKLMKKRNKSGIRIGYNESSTCGLSNFNLIFDHFKNGDYVKVKNGLTIYYRDDVASYLHRLYISFENGRLELRDIE